MRKTLLAIAALAPLAAVAGLALPVLAQSGPRSAETGEESCLGQPAEPAAGPIDLDKIPVKPVTGPLAVQGGGECDDVALEMNGDDDARTAVDVNDDRAGGGLGEHDD